LGLVGNKEPYFAFGRDVFNEPERKPVAFNCVNQVYQCITDSTTFYFDTKKVLKTVAGQAQEKDEDLLKAVLQHYAESLNNQTYTIKE
jgi:membrane-anchored protein YejM (alkaline phosphatase superfamily)